MPTGAAAAAGAAESAAGLASGEEKVGSGLVCRFGLCDEGGPLADAGAATGGLLALYMTGQSLNIYSQIGMILLIGLMTKNGILIVEFANQLRGAKRKRAKKMERKQHKSK